MRRKHWHMPALFFPPPGKVTKRGMPRQYLMKIYPKILLITLPLIVVSVLLTGVIAHAISRSAIRNVVEGSLALRLSQIMSTLGQDKAGAAGSEEHARQSAMAYLKAIHFGRTGNVLVIDKKGKIVGHQDKNIEGMEVGSRRWFAQMDQARTGKVQFVLEGENHWGVYTYFEPWGWYVVCNGSEKDLAGPIASLGQTVLILVLFCLVAAAIPLLILARWLTGPIYTLIEGTEKIRAGRLETHIPIATSDEIGILAGAFNAMTARLRELIGSLEERNDQLKKEINDRVGIQEELAKSELKYRSIFDNAVEGIFQSNFEGRFADVNNSFAAILGYASPEAVKAEITNAREQMYVFAEDRERFLSLLASHDVVTGFECQVKRKDGSTGWISLSAKPTRDEFGNVRIIYGYCVDITAQKHAEQEKLKLEEQLRQSQKMEAIGNLAGGIAHDFNNLLHAISGYLQLLLLHKEEDHPDRKYLIEMDRASQRASDLIRRLLTFSRKMKVRPILLDLNEAIGATCRMLERTIPKMVDIDLLLTDDLHPLEADPVQVEQVLINLVNNAVDAMDGRGQLTIRTENFYAASDLRSRYLEIQSGDYVRLSVSDTGLGMDSATLEHIFEPFYTTKEVGKGTGLGLATVYGIVKGHRGHISCYSEVNKGTTFDIYFPVSPLDYAVEEEDRQELSVALDGSGTILLVDDENFILEIGEEMLRSHGYNVIRAESGEEALEIFRARSEEIDLVVMDLGMPGMGGEQCLQELKAIAPEIKVIVASGYTGHKMAKAPEQFGAAGFLSKPYRLNRLLVEVRKLLSQ
jgi:PAS domain S-box-containing protein